MMATGAFAQIPNNGFETWTTIGAYENPANWGTMNNTTAPNNVYTATKATPGNPGSSYLKLTSKTSGATVVNGIAVSGKLDTVTLKPVSGFAFTQRPASFGGKWQHMIFGSSQGSVKVLTSRWNLNTATRDTVAYGEQVLTGMAMSWANFNLNMNYKDSLNYPDSCIIVLQASGTNPANNDYLWVDNLAFTGSVAVVTPPGTVGFAEMTGSLNGLSVFPNPAHETLFVNFSLLQPQSITIGIFDANGRLVISQKKNTVAGETKEQIDIKALPKGVYLLRVTGQQNTRVENLLIE